jgi:hypothetical protein
LQLYFSSLYMPNIICKQEIGHYIENSVTSQEKFCLPSILSAVIELILILIVLSYVCFDNSFILCLFWVSGCISKSLLDVFEVWLWFLFIWHFYFNVHRVREMVLASPSLTIPVSYREFWLSIDLEWMLP